ncbi:MAG: hypothetical protein JWP58_52, partial [Hymenobacter sp.]|nr:hypothetical protein [Hymenobacter sp.]
MQAAIQQLQEQLCGADDEQQDQNSNSMNNNKSEGEAFLAENAQ